MIRYFSLSTLGAALLLTTGCGKVVEDYVRNGDRREVTLPSVSSSSPTVTKISPGANRASGKSVKSSFAITPTNRIAAGATVKSRHSFHAFRPAASTNN